MCHWSQTPSPLFDPTVKVKVLVLRLISDIHLTLQDFTFPSLACSLLSPSQLPGEGTVLVNPQLIVLTRLYWVITASLLSANLSTAQKLEGWKDWLGLEVGRPGIDPGSLALETLTTKPRYLPPVASLTSYLVMVEEKILTGKCPSKSISMMTPSSQYENHFRGLSNTCF